MCSAVVLSVFVCGQESGLNETVNNWDKVDDFNWLAAASPSPNWSLLPPGQRRTSWDLSTTTTTS